jgi:CheY-like chemotaxis protein
LPGLSAIAVVSKLRDYRHGLRVIALSGRPEAGQAALEAGADAFVSKGDPPEALIAAINVCRKQKRCESKRDQPQT